MNKSDKIRKKLIILLNLVIFWCILPLLLFLSGNLVNNIFVTSNLGYVLKIISLVICIYGAYLAFYSIILLKTKGKGLPISALPPKYFTRTGPYKYARHPIYTGFTLILFGLGILTNNLGLSLIIVPLFSGIWFFTWVKLYEEPILLKRFGNTYRVYMKESNIFLPFSLKNIIRIIILKGFRTIFKIEVLNKSNISKKDSVIYVSDHLSYFDFMFAQFVCDKPISIPTTAEVFRSSISRIFITIMRGFPKRRFCSDPSSALYLQDELALQNNVGIAVEGERSWTGELSLPVKSVAKNLLMLNCTLVPMCCKNSYKFWPRWAESFNKNVKITVEAGEPFNLKDELLKYNDKNSNELDEIEKARIIIYNKINELRDPTETSCNLSDYKKLRPELVLWKCPVCKEDETLEYDNTRWLKCNSCSSKWDSKDGDLTYISNDNNKNKKDTIAGWYKNSIKDFSINNKKNSDECIISSENAELRIDENAKVTLNPLEIIGTGSLNLFYDKLVFNYNKNEIVFLIKDVHSVTTERNNTLQLGIKTGVVQFVFDKSSPFRWQTYLQHLVNNSSFANST